MRLDLCALKNLLHGILGNKCEESRLQVKSITGWGCGRRAVSCHRFIFTIQVLWRRQLVMPPEVYDHRQVSSSWPSYAILFRRFRVNS